MSWFTDRLGIDDDRLPGGWEIETVQDWNDDDINTAATLAVLAAGGYYGYDQGWFSGSGAGAAAGAGAGAGSRRGLVARAARNRTYYVSQRQIRRTRPKIYRSLGNPFKDLYPKRLTAKLRYSTLEETIDPAAATAGRLEISCNGIFDVEPAVGGHQPMGFDEMMTQYDHFTVISSKIKFTCMPAAGEDPIAFILGITDTSGTTYGVERLSEQPGAGKVKLTSDLGLTSGGPSKVVLQKTWSLKKRHGAKPMAATALSEWRGTSSANPQEEEYFHLECQSLNASANPSPIYVYIEAEYNVVFSERKKTALS